jgi:hypothetical protein
MESIHTQREQGSHIIRCQECGQECTQVEFIRGLNVCDHLGLDSLAIKTERARSNPAVALFPIHDSQKEEGMHCLRCQGLMWTETFFDLQLNTEFQGWRCLFCGNVWDPVIGDNRMPVEHPHVSPKPSVPVRKEGLSVQVKCETSAPKIRLSKAG